MAAGPQPHNPVSSLQCAPETPPQQTHPSLSTLLETTLKMKHKQIQYTPVHPSTTRTCAGSSKSPMLMGCQPLSSHSTVCRLPSKPRTLPCTDSHTYAAAKPDDNSFRHVRQQCKGVPSMQAVQYSLQLLRTTAQLRALSVALSLSSLKTS